MRSLLLIGLILFSSLAFGRDCIPKRGIRDFRVTQRDQLQVRSQRDWYRLDTRFCPELRWADRITFRTWPSNSFSVCPGDDVILLDMMGRFIDQCKIWNIQKVGRR